MRWFVALLLVANVILYVWTQQQSRPPATAGALPPPEIGRLRVLSGLVDDEVSLGAMPDASLDPALTTPITDVETLSQPSTGRVVRHLVEGSASAASIAPVAGGGTAVDDPVQGASDVRATAADPRSMYGPIPDGGAVAEGHADAETTSVPGGVASRMTEEPAEENEAAEDQATPETQAAEVVQGVAVAGETQQTGETREARVAAETDAAQVTTEESQEVGAAQVAQANEETGVAEVDQAIEETREAQEVAGVAAQTGPARATTEETQEVGAAELAQAPQVADAATGKPLCARIGPLVPADADALIDQMSPRLRLESDVSEMHEQVNGYYVLIPALPSRAAGRQKLKELAEAGFDDTWLFRSGSLRNAISLGLFRREASARRHAERVARKGFTTEVKQNLSVRERRWLLIRDTGGDRLGAELTLPAGVAREPHPCP